jgi:hypothetical protein
MGAKDGAHGKTQGPSDLPSLTHGWTVGMTNAFLFSWTMQANHVNLDFYSNMFTVFCQELLFLSLFLRAVVKERFQWQTFPQSG